MFMCFSFIFIWIKFFIFELIIILLIKIVKLYEYHLVSQELIKGKIEDLDRDVVFKKNPLK